MSAPTRRPSNLFSTANIVLVTITLIAIAAIPNLLVFLFNVGHEVFSSVRTILYIFLGILLGALVLRSMLVYLEPVNTLKPLERGGSEHEPVSYTSEIMSEQIAESKEQMKGTGTVTVDVKDMSKDQLIESLRSTINQEFTEGILKSIDEEFAKRDLQNKEWERFITGFEEVRKRLYEETNNLARRASLNLAFGSITTVLAVIGLASIIFLMPLDLKGHAKDEYGWLITAHYVPRLSLVVFAEVFAYFFLRLYKTGLEDIKYYQNELTNVELKLSALKAALVTKDNEIIKLVIGELAKVERNFVLKRGETTVGIEKIKTENLNAKELLEHVATLLGTKPRG